MCLYSGGVAGCERTPTRLRPGTSSFSSPRRLPASSAEVDDSPVTLPSGRAKLGTSPIANGSNTFAKTIGTDVVAFLAGTAAGEDEATMTSTFDRTSSSTPVENAEAGDERKDPADDHQARLHHAAGQIVQRTLVRAASTVPISGPA